MKNLIKSKKADMNVLIMVFMAVIVFVSMLFMFITSQKNIIKELPSAEVVEAVYVEQNKVIFYAKDAGEKALVGLDKKNVLFGVQFKDRFKEELNKNAVDISYIEDLKDKLDKVPSEIEFTFNTDSIEILINNYQIRESEVSKSYTMIKIWRFIPTFSYEEKITQLLGIAYNPDIKVIIPL